MPVTPVEFCLVTVIMVLGTVVQASIGFGLAVLSAPLLLLLDPSYVPGAIIVPVIMLTFMMARRDREAIQKQVLAVAVLGRVVGTIPAAYAMGVMSQSAFDAVFGSMVLGAVLLSISHLHVSPTAANVLLASIVSAFTGTISSIGGPPLVLIYQRETGAAIRGTLSTIFFIGATISLFGLWCVGKFGRHELMLSLTLFPGVMLGFYASRWTVRILDGGHMRPAVLALTTFAALAVLCRAFFG